MFSSSFESVRVTVTIVVITSFALRYVWLMVNTMSLVLAVIACTETKDASERKGR